MQTTMMDLCGVYRTEETLTQAAEDIRVLKEQYATLGVQDKGSVFNTGLLEILELGNLLDLAQATVASALAPRKAGVPTLARTSPTAMTRGSSSTPSATRMAKGPGWTTRRWMWSRWRRRVSRCRSIR